MSILNEKCSHDIFIGWKQKCEISKNSQCPERTYERREMCDICKQTPCHPRCPNYIPPNPTAYCSICGDGICGGEEYIRNQDGEYIHDGCLPETRKLVEWLGGNYGVMENE